MKSLRIESSVREAEKVANALRDMHFACDFVRESSNVWELKEYDEDELGEYPGDDYVTEQLEDLKYEIEEGFQRYGIDKDEVEVSIF